MLSSAAWAGGSGLNVVVVVNQNSPNSVQLGNDYCEQRGVPPQNLLRMTGWTGGNTFWSRADFEANLREPLLAMLAAAGLTNQIQYVLLSMDIPYRVQEGDSANSTTSVLFYGYKTNSVPPPDAPATCSLPDYSSNSYAFSESPFTESPPNTADTNSFLSFILTDDSLAGAESILSRALAAGSSFPTQAVFLEKNSDPARNVRFFSFDNAIFDSRVSGDSSVVRIKSDSADFASLRGFQTGFANLGLATNAFVPGGLGDSLTSYAGDLFENSQQTPLLVFLNAGAVASYGTVTEPCNYLQKFPDPLVFFYQRRGFNTAEAYYQSLLNPYQGLFVGEPLCAPFAQAGQADWPALTNATVLSGTVTLPVALFTSAGTNLPLAQVDLFIDGVFSRTLTNIPPSAGSLLSVGINGAVVQYSVPQASSLSSVASGLAAALNAQSNSTRVVAYSAGDRLELQSLDLKTPGTNVLLSATASAGGGSLQTVFLTPAQPFFLESIATGYHGLTVTNSTQAGDWLQLAVTKTNGVQVTLSVTNAVGDTNVANLCQLLMNTINAEPALQGPDGVIAADLYPDTTSAEFFVYARSAGWAAAQATVTMTASPDLIILPAGTKTLEDNLPDLRPRNHLYLDDGFARLSLSASLDTAQLADGFHELTLVAYQGNSVRTQTRVSRLVQVRNTSLSANLAAQVAGTNVTEDFPLTIAVTANSNVVRRIELFSTGGLIGVVTNQSAALFPVPSELLGLGRHPFFAVVTDSFGRQFRTQTIDLRIVPALGLSISPQPPALSWTSVPGLTYGILSSSNVLGPFQPATTLVASGTNVQWQIPGPPSAPAFYRVQLRP